MLRSFFPWAVVRGWIRRRLVPVLLAVAFAFGLSMGFDARADAPAIMYRYSYGGYTGKWGATYDAACANLYATRGTAWGASVSFKITTAGGTVCGMYNGTQYLVGLSPASGLGCADGSDPDTTKPNASQCGAPPPNCSDASLLNKYRGAGVTGPVAGIEAPSLICVQGCGYVGGSVMTVMNGTYSGRLGAATGKACTTGANYDIIDTTMYDGSKDVPPTPLSCADKGQVYGTVNGVGGCYATSSIPGSSVTHNDTSTSAKTDASGVQAAPETTNTTTTITNNNGVTNITQVTTKSDGTKTSTTTTKGLFCAANPNDAVCKDGDSVTGGETCAAPPVCNGDAIQCAMLQQQYKTRCDMVKTNASIDASVALGQQLANGQDPMASQLPTPSKPTEVDLSNRLANVDDMGIAAQCIPDLHIALPALPGASGGASLNISTAPLCDFGKLFGILNVLGTTVLCAYMLRGSF